MEDELEPEERAQLQLENEQLHRQLTTMVEQVRIGSHVAP